MSLLQQAFRGALWLSLFKGIGQVLSWCATIVIARLLLPADYGLMEMATVLTGYVQLFIELGLGAAIIQREKIEEEELSSLFWFMCGWGLLLAVACLGLAYPTVTLFHEPQLLPITQAVGVLFILAAVVIVPRNLLHRELRFKEIGWIEAVAVVASCVVMIVAAWHGAGVWTLIGGHIVRELVQTVLIVIVARWRPRLHFSFNEIKPYLRFGMNLVVSNSLRYVYLKADRFFGGRVLGPVQLGYYSLALQLAAIPTDKIVSLINSVLFPVFARYQSDKEQFNRLYLHLVALLAMVTAPLFIGGILVADDLIPFLLGEKWRPAIFPFKLLCVAELIIAVTTPNALVNVAQGRPRWTLYFHMVTSVLMTAGFYIAASFGDLDYLALPWLVVYPITQSGFILATLRKLGITVREYLSSLFHPAAACVAMSAAVWLTKSYPIAGDSPLGQLVQLCLCVLAGGSVYCGYFLVFQRSYLTALNELRKNG